MKEWHIVKVQVSLMGAPGTLIYNEDHSIEVRTERRFGEKLLGEDIKGYFDTTYNTKTGILTFENRTCEQDW